MKHLKIPVVQNIILCAAALCMAWGLKYHYSIARAENLKWILAPTAALVEIITGRPFDFETGTGYINRDLRIIIAPACAGANFLIAAFTMFFGCGIFRISGLTDKIAWLAGSAACAYIATITVNAVRIRISIAMIADQFHAGWLTPQRAHRMTGILIYFFFLSVFYHIIQKIIQNIRMKGAEKTGLKQIPEKQKIRTCHFLPTGILPIACYWTVAIGVPWLNAAHQKDPAGFTENSLTVVVLSLMIFSALSVVNLFTKRQKVKLHETQNTDHRRRTGHNRHHPVRP